MKKILILGGNGFLGKNLNIIFKNSVYEIYNESRQTGCDILNYNEFEIKIRTLKPDFIINSAAHVGSISYFTKNAANVCFDNTQMYLNIFKAICNASPKSILINPISNCSYPGIIDVQHEELWWDGIIHSSVESYGNPKKIGYILSECYRKQYELQTINIILPNAYGPLDYVDIQKTHAMNGIIIRMLKAIKNKDKIFQLWGTGKPVREWIYMQDAARVIKNIIDNEMFDLPNPINIGQEVGISINDSVMIIKSILNSNIEIVHDLSKEDGAPVKVLGKSNFDKYFKNFNFTNYELGLENTINYYKSIL
jgi:GDP-L-fucose synthase